MSYSGAQYGVFQDNCIQIFESFKSSHLGKSINSKLADTVSFQGIINIVG